MEYETTLSWIQDFLSDRTQTVVLEGNSSSTNPAASGVPLGTVLGPLLFLVYINDMPGNARSQTRLFADDCIGRSASPLTVPNIKKT
jgi:hypothetical protein